MTNDEVATTVETVKKKRGRPKGSGKKKVADTQVFPKYKYDPDKDYRYWFIADACGCKIGSNINGSAMFCRHKNSMHLEERKK